MKFDSMIFIHDIAKKTNFEDICSNKIETLKNILHTKRGFVVFNHYKPS